MEESKIPSEITKICSYLSTHHLKLSSRHSDGRINAAINEDEILNTLESHFDFIRPRARAWYDLAIEDSSHFYPINIKVTDTTHADNLNCKLGIYYALTGLKPSFPNEIDWLDFFENLRNDFGTDQEQDYYFLIVNKQNPTDTFCATLRGLQTLTPNGNNLPFQCKWNSNRQVKRRNFDEASQFILKTFGESIKLRSSIYFNFKRLFPEYV